MSKKLDLFDELIAEVRRSQGATQRFDEAVADALGINRTDMRCLDVLEREGSVTAGRLAEATGLTAGAMTTALDRLEAAGYARRVRDDSDRRRVLVEATPLARELGATYFAEHATLSQALYDRYTVAEMELLLGFVRRGREFNERRAGEVERENRSRPAPSARRRAGRRDGG
jgi:DNA-binding MarR family transcriptional regulator